MSALLDRLDGVKETGPGRWVAKCPAHEDKSPSLSIRQTEDGTWLLHCFAQCPALDVVQAVGLTLADLFPDKAEYHRSPSRSRIPASDALAAIDHEVKVVAIIATDLIECRAIDEATWKRLAQAAARIGQARSMSCPARKAAA